MHYDGRSCAQGQTLGQTTGADHLNSVGVNLDEDVGAVAKSVSVHECIGDRLAQGQHASEFLMLPLGSAGTYEQR